MIKYITTLILIIFTYFSHCFSDYRSEERIAPGAIYYHEYNSSGPWHIHVLEIDLRDSLVELESIKADNSLFARQKTSMMSERMSRENHYVSGAINADFFEWNGIPVGAQVINGQLINEPTFRSVFGMTVDKNPFIDIVSWKGQLFFTNEIVNEFEGLNRRRKTDGLFLFNSYYDADTLSHSGGMIIHAELTSEDFATNDTMKFQIIGIQKSENGIINPTDIAENEIILVGPNQDKADIKVGDEIQILLNLDSINKRVNQLVGGLPRLIRDGDLSIDWKTEKIRESFSTKRHPRTAVGFTKDKQKVYLFVVDGRQPGFSIGMTLPELAIYMLEWGIYQGVNLDGGGSTTMVVQGEMVNRPSDATGERPVANALMVVNTETTSPVLKLNIVPDEVIVSPRTKHQFQINIQDLNYHPLNMASDSATWYCDPELGKVDTTGLFTADSLVNTGYLYVQIRTMIDSAKISIIDDVQNKR